MNLRARMSGRTSQALLAFSLLFSGMTVSAVASAHEHGYGNERTATETARDEYRHPVETLAFFDVQPDQTVVEIWPGGGWYTAILAPMLKDEGQLIAAHFPAETEVGYFRRSRAAFEERFLADTEMYGDIQITELAPPALVTLAEPGTADRVLTFRNVHNWMNRGNEQAVFEAAYAALKPGGILGVVEHRAPASFSREQMVKSGYVTEQLVIDAATSAGFELLASSEINANPADTKDYEYGVWTLPPTLRGGDENREAMLAIGESDRMTLKFVK